MSETGSGEKPLFSYASVKRVLQNDEEVGRISHASVILAGSKSCQFCCVFIVKVILTEKATELFLFELVTAAVTNKEDFSNILNKEDM